MERRERRVCRASPSIATPTSSSCSGCPAGALPWRDELYDAIEAAWHPRGIYEQRRLRPLAGGGPPEPATRARGEEAPLELVVEDGSCRFGVDVTAPLGVGLFPDMRLGWAAVAARSPGRKVLNLFSYTGAFSVHAAKAGAAEVVAVDVAPKVHARARRNFELSGLDPAKLEAITADAVKTLERFASRGRSFDIVVCDPPTFSHGPAGQFSVARDLAQLAAACVSVLAPGGFLVFATNSTKISVGRAGPGDGRGWRRRRRRSCASSNGSGCRPTIRSRRGSRRGTTSRSRSRSACPSGRRLSRASSRGGCRGS